MPEPSAFLYMVNNMTGCAIGISDYGFSCVIYAASEDEARDWGITVAIEFAAKNGFSPHAIKPSDDEIVRNSFVLECPDPDGADHTCRLGEFPEALR